MDGWGFNMDLGDTGVCGEGNGFPSNTAEQEVKSMDSGETGILKLKALAIWSAVEGQPGAGLAVRF